MKTLLAEVQEVMNALFERYPSLCGFSVSEDLSFANVACHPALTSRESMMLCEEISTVLAELLDNGAEAARLLRGRTVARTFQ
jgi:hypothetical protein